MQAIASHTQDKPGDNYRDEVLAEVRRRVALGIPVKRACEQVGVIRSTYYRWEEEARKEGESPAKEPRPETSPETGGHQTTEPIVPEDQPASSTPNKTPGHKEA